MPKAQPHAHGGMGRRAVLFGAAAVTTLAAAFGLYRLASAPPEPMDERALGRSTRQVASLAADTALLAELVAAGKATGPFFRAHRGKLEEALVDETRKLDDALPPARKREGMAVRDLAAELGSGIDELGRTFTEPASLQAIRQDAQQVAVEAHKLEPTR